MKYLIRNSTTNVIEMMFETPVTPSPPMEVISIDDSQYREKMLGAIFADVNNFKPLPAGDFWVSDGTKWVDGRTEEEVWEDVRYARDQELAATDWTQLDDADLTPPEKNVWAQYRANIRDASMSVGVGSPRIAEETIKTEKGNNRPDKDETDPRRGRGRGSQPTTDPQRLR